MHINLARFVIRMYLHNVKDLFQTDVQLLNSDSLKNLSGRVGLNC